MDNPPTLSKIRLLPFNIRCAVLILATLAIIAAFACQPRIAQDQAYHLFADRRSMLGIPNFQDVASNIPFLAAFAVGILRFRNTNWLSGARHSYGFFIIGLGATCFGSIYYHFSPSSEKLLWDRLPMTIAFMGFLSTLISLRISDRWGLRLLGPLLLCGFLSVFYWSYSESIGAGDLRPYLFVQFGMILISILILLLFPGRQPTLAAFNMLLIGYALAKICEEFDLKIFQYSAGNISGHTLKHLYAGIGCYVFIWMTPLNYKKAQHDVLGCGR